MGFLCSFWGLNRFWKAENADASGKTRQDGHKRRRAEYSDWKKGTKAKYVNGVGRSRRSLFSSLMCWWGLFFSLVLSLVCSLPQEQTDSLMSLYNSTSGEYWLRRNLWNTGSDPCSPAWEGVQCANDVVTGLGLYQNNLTGTLPNLLLPNLTSL